MPSPRLWTPSSPVTGHSSLAPRDSLRRALPAASLKLARVSLPSTAPDHDRIAAELLAGGQSARIARAGQAVVARGEHEHGTASRCAIQGLDESRGGLRLAAEAEIQHASALGDRIVRGLGDVPIEEAAAAAGSAGARRVRPYRKDLGAAPGHDDARHLGPVALGIPVLGAAAGDDVDAVRVDTPVEYRGSRVEPAIDHRDIEGIRVGAVRRTAPPRPSWRA